MAVLKHIVSKNANYGESLDYLLFQHDERTKKPILNEHTRGILSGWIELRTNVI